MNIQNIPKSSKSNQTQESAIISPPTGSLSGYSVSKTSLSPNEKNLGYPTSRSSVGIAKTYKSQSQRISDDNDTQRDSVPISNLQSTVQIEESQILFQLLKPPEPPLPELIQEEIRAPLIIEFSKFISKQIHRYVITNGNYYTGMEPPGRETDQQTYQQLTNEQLRNKDLRRSVMIMLNQHLQFLINVINEMNQLFEKFKQDSFRFRNNYFQKSTVQNFGFYEQQSNQNSISHILQPPLWIDQSISTPENITSQSFIAQGIKTLDPERRGKLMNILKIQENSRVRTEISNNNSHRSTIKSQYSFRDQRIE